MIVLAGWSGAAQAEFPVDRCPESSALQESKQSMGRGDYEGAAKLLAEEKILTADQTLICFFWMIRGWEIPADGYRDLATGLQEIYRSGIFQRSKNNSLLYLEGAELGLRRSLEGLGEGGVGTDTELRLAKILWEQVSEFDQAHLKREVEAILDRHLESHPENVDPWASEILGELRPQESEEPAASSDGSPGQEKATNSEPPRVDRRPLKFYSPQPPYTDVARYAKVEGQVILECVIREDGSVTDVRVLQGLPMGLSAAAVQTVRTWKFRPAIIDGKSSAVHYRLAINFLLRSSESHDSE